jgi:hypothetical protein
MDQTDSKAISEASRSRERGKTDRRQCDLISLLLLFFKIRKAKK